MINEKCTYLNSKRKLVEVEQNYLIERNGLWILTSDHTPMKIVTFFSVELGNAKKLHMPIKMVNSIH